MAFEKQNCLVFHNHDLIYFSSCRQFALLHLRSDGHYIYKGEQARGIEKAMGQIMTIGQN
jgi:hypothetical protein